MPTPSGEGEGHNQRAVLARHVGIPRGQRPQACTETTRARTGISCDHPSRHAWVALKSLRTQANDERSQEVGQTHSSNEAREQSWPSDERYRRGNGGAGGAKGFGQREDATAKHEPDTGPDHRAKWAGANTASSGER